MRVWFSFRRGSPGRRKRRGFTLIELMVAVGILGILVTVAAPAFVRFQLKAKASEGKANLGALRVAQESYLMEYGSMLSALPVVPTTVNQNKQDWPLTGGSSHGFNVLGWSPEGQVFYQYGLTSNGATAYTIAARSDLDGDGIYNTWGYVRPVPGTAAGVVGPFSTCQASGVYSPHTLSQDLRIEIGPCDSASGRTEF